MMVNVSVPFKAVLLQLGGFTEEFSTLEISCPDPTPDTRSSISCAILPSSVLEVACKTRDTKSLEEVSYRRGPRTRAGTHRGDNHAEEPPAYVEWMWMWTWKHAILYHMYKGRLFVRAALWPATHTSRTSSRQ